MAFHDVLFPVAISRGSKTGPRLNVDTIRTDSGGAEKVGRWPTALRTFDARQGIRTVTDLYSVYEFFLLREGTLNGFRFEDPIDNTTAADGRSAPTNLDALVGTGDGSNKTFQLIKSYGKGTIYEKQRAIQKPVSGSILVALNGTNNTAFTTDLNTGKITFTTAPAAGVQVTAGCRFHVACTFGESLDKDALEIALESSEIGGIESLPIEEMPSGATTPERYFHGRGSTQVITGDARYDWGWGMAVVFVATANAKILMPSTLDLESGNNYPFFYNASVGGQVLTFRNESDSQTLWTLNPGAGALSLIYVLSGSKLWGAIGG